MIEAIELSSIRRGRTALDQVSFDVYPGQVTALVGTAGSGKSTVLRMMAELEPCRGRTLYDGRPYHALHPAIREVGLALDPGALHPRRSVAGHLALYCAAGGVPKARIADVLEIAGLSVQSAAKCGRLDASQRQRLAIAAALLGDPAALLLDEPRGLDEHGMAWFHALLRAYAAQGRTVLVAASGPEALTGTVDHVIVLRRDDGTGRTRVVASRSAAEVFDTRRASVVIARSPQASRLAALLEDQGAHLAAAGGGALEVRGMDRARIGELAHGAGICLHELAEVVQDDVFGWQALPRQKALGPTGPIVLGEDEDGEPSAEATPATGGELDDETIPAVRAWRSGVRLVPDPKHPGGGSTQAEEESADAALATLREPQAGERRTEEQRTEEQRTEERRTEESQTEERWTQAALAGLRAEERWRDATPVEAAHSTPPRQTRDDVDGADVGGETATLRQRADDEPVSQAVEGAGQDQPPVPFTVLAPWKAAVSAGERPAREEPEDRPFTTPAPTAPEGRNPKPPETVPWYAAPSVVGSESTSAGDAAADAERAPRSTFAPYGSAPSRSAPADLAPPSPAPPSPAPSGPAPSGFAPGSNVSAPPRSTSHVPTAPTPTAAPAPEEAQA